MFFFWIEKDFNSTSTFQRFNHLIN